MKQSRRYYQAYDDRYRQIHEQSLHWFSEAPSPIVLEIMNKYQVSKASAILEIGCGEGRDAAYLLQNGYPVLATDVSTEAVKYCRKQFPEYADSFQVLDCLTERLSGTYDFIYAVSVLHMLVEEKDRARFYRFLYEQLKSTGIALICTMGNGTEEWRTDASQAFHLEKRVHRRSGREVCVAATSCRTVSFETLKAEIQAGSLLLLESGMTSIIPDFPTIMYAVVKRAPA
mgnify:FL=1